MVSPLRRMVLIGVDRLADRLTVQPCWLRGEHHGVSRAHRLALGGAVDYECSECRQVSGVCYFAGPKGRDFWLAWSHTVEKY